MNEQLILKIIESVEPQLFWLLLKFITIGVVLLVIKGCIEKVVAYLFFRWDPDLGKGVKVFIQGQEGEIKDYNLSCIYISTHDRIIIIRMRRWLYSKFALVKDNVGDRVAPEK